MHVAPEDQAILPQPSEATATARDHRQKRVTAEDFVHALFALEALQKHAWSAEIKEHLKTACYHLQEASQILVFEEKVQEMRERKRG